MSQEIKINFTEEDWKGVTRDWTAWWAGELDRPIVINQSWQNLSSGVILPSAPDFVSNLPGDIPADEVVERYGVRFERRFYYGAAWPKWWPNFGPGIVAGFLGAKVHSVPETVWFSPAKNVPIEDLYFSYDPNNFWLKRVKEITRSAVEQWGNRVSVGHTDLGGNLDILASFRTTEQLLIDLIEAPEEVARLSREITQLWIRYYDELYEIIRRAGRGTTPWAPIWSPQRCYMLQCDFSYMISPAMFERFVMPDITACCNALDHGFYHLDGKGQIPHLDLLLSVKRLRGIQWIPGAGQPSAEAWLPLLKKIRDAGKLCQVYVSHEEALTIVREIGGRGFAFNVDGPTTAADTQNFIRRLVAEDAKC